ncbi:HVO_0234 family beta-propeller protein [Halorientalis pallida]|uniref:HVO_0234 family beta-propeller protein n=1 Tax=Halorientalis pallida TaxID=2479928 RepID=UPI003C6F86F2
MSDADISLDEKRVYGEKTGTTELYVAADLGVAVVAVSADIVGEFSLAHRCTARDVAAGPDSLAVATDEDVLESADGGYAETGFGPAVAVGFDDDDVLAAGPDGTVARREAGGDEWTTLGTVEDVRAIDGDLLASAAGVYRVGDGLDHVGLADARDVATGGTPLAATDDGLYYLGPGWATGMDGAFTAVASSPERGHAATADALYEGDGEDWRECEVPTGESVVAVTHGTGTYAVTAQGTVLVNAGDGWRSRALGLPGVSGLAVAPES